MSAIPMNEARVITSTTVSNAVPRSARSWTGESAARIQVPRREIEDQVRIGHHQAAPLGGAGSGKRPAGGAPEARGYHLRPDADAHATNPQQVGVEPIRGCAIRAPG